MDNTSNDAVHALLMEILHTRRSLRQAIKRMLKKSNVNMTFEMFQIMSYLLYRDGVSQQVLAERTVKTKTCMTNLINNLETKDWVIRRKDTEDKRNQLIFLTDTGREVSEEIHQLLNDFHCQISKKISGKQMEEATNQLLKLSRILDEI